MCTVCGGMEVHVSNIPESLDKNQLLEYFQSQEHGGSYMTDIAYPLRNNEAVLLYKHHKGESKFLFRLPLAYYFSAPSLGHFPPPPLAHHFSTSTCPPFLHLHLPTISLPPPAHHSSASICPPFLHLNLPTISLSPPAYHFFVPICQPFLYPHHHHYLFFFRCMLLFIPPSPTLQLT